MVRDEKSRKKNLYETKADLSGVLFPFRYGGDERRGRSKTGKTHPVPKVESPVVPEGLRYKPTLRSMCVQRTRGGTWGTMESFVKKLRDTIKS